MKTHALHLRHTPRRGHTASVVPRLLHAVTSRYLGLPIGAAAALVWANTGPESYFTFALALAFPVNAIAMVFFFGLLAQELYEEMMPGGALHHRRRWPVPLIGQSSSVAPKSCPTTRPTGSSARPYRATNESGTSKKPSPKARPTTAITVR